MTAIDLILKQMNIKIMPRLYKLVVYYDNQLS